MSLRSEVRERLRAIFFRASEDRELEEEMRFHLEQETLKNQREGMDRAEARRRALVAFGGVDRYTERVRDERGTLWLDEWTRDFRHAARGLARAPVFTVVVVVTLALAIGASASIFSVVRPVLLAPLPFPHADRLVYIGGTAPGTDQPEEFGVPDELYFEYRDRVPALEDVGLYSVGATTVRAEEQVEQLFGTAATPSLFTTLGVRPLLGRPYTEDDGDGVVILSHWLWESWFGSNPNVIGRSYDFLRQTRTVIGVMPPEFRFPDERVAFWFPFPTSPATVRPGGFGPNMIARVAPGTDPSSLVAELQPLARSVQQRIGGPAPYADIMARHRPVVRSLREQLVGRVTTPLWIMSAAVGIVFLIACANVANLFAVRAESRSYDLAVRRALGAGRARLVRAQMAEALLVAGAGGIGGALVALAAVPVLVRLAPESVAGGYLSPPIPGLAAARLDLNTLAFTATASVLAACVFGLLPAVHFSAAALGKLRKAGSGIAGRRSMARDALVVLQTASALVLLVGSALLVRSFWHLTRVDPGYRTEDVFTFQIEAGRGRLSGGGLGLSNLHHTIMDRLAALPDVESAGYVTQLPLDEGAREGFFTTRDIDAIGGEAPRIRFAGVGGDYFQTMGIELLSGRFFERAEEQQLTLNVILSAAAAELLFPGRDAVGRQFQEVDFPGGPGPGTSYTVTGVVEDVLLDDFRRESPEPIAYMPMAVLSPAFVVRSKRADQLAAEVRGVIREVVPESPMFRVFTMEQLAANTMASLSFTMRMVGVAAALATLLGAVGIYGVLSYVVTRQTREIAVRMALGEERQRIRRMVVLQGGRVALVGIMIGLLTAFGTAHVLESLLFGIQAIDPSTFVVTPLVMLAVALLASYMPARQASAVNPLRALQSD